MSTASDAIALEEVRETRHPTTGQVSSPDRTDGLLRSKSDPRDNVELGNKQPIPAASRSSSSSSSGSSTAETRVPAYSVFPKAQKWAIVLMAASSAFFSPISATIFLPALTDIASDLRVSINAINTTVTVYMVFQGLSPSLWGR